jgi:hypothetical protein
MSISGIVGIGAAAAYQAVSGSTSASTSVSPSSPQEEFLEYARMTPAERIRAAILEEMGISEDEIENLEPARRDTIEKEIAKRIRDKLEEAAEKKTGMIVDVTV